MLGTIDTNALVPVIALYAKSLGADLLQVGLIVGLYSAVHVPANLVFGRLADRYGRKLPLSVGLLWDAVSVFLYSLATTPLGLALARVSHGLGGGLVGPSTMSLVADMSEPGRRGRGMAMYGISIALAVVIGFAIAGPIVNRLGYDALFYFLAAGLVVGFLISLGIREAVRIRGRGRLDWGRLWRYVKRPDPAAGYLAIFSLYFMLGAFVALVPLWLEDTLGYGPLEVGLSFTTFAVLSLILHYPAGILADRVGPGVPAFIGIVATGCAMATIPLARGIGGIVLTMALFGIGHGFVFPSASTLVTRRTDPEQRGIVTGLFYSVLVAGVAIGAPVMASVAAPSNYALGIWASSWVALVGLAFIARAILAVQGPPSVSAEPSPGDRGSF